MARVVVPSPVDYFPYSLFDNAGEIVYFRIVQGGAAAEVGDGIYRLIKARDAIVVAVERIRVKNGRIRRKRINMSPNGSLMGLVPREIQNAVWRHITSPS